MINIVLLGPPGAGKGTQSEKIVQKYGLTPIMPGNLMREQIQKGTEVGKLLASYIDEGQLAPHEVTMQLIEEQLAANPHSQGFLFDGFPRAIEQANSLDELLPKHGCQLDGVLFLQVPEAEVQERIKRRSQTFKRGDDDKVAVRLSIYQKETLPLVNYYAKQHKLFQIDGMGTQEAVFERIVAVLDKLYQNKLKK